jgi:hypothetical protein
MKNQHIVAYKKPRNTLRLPDLDQAKSAVLSSLPSKESQRGYRHAIEEFVAWYCSEPRLSFNKAVVTRYQIHLESRQLAPGTINGRLAAVRRLAYEAADSGLLSPELAAGIRRVKGPKKLGVRLGNWLTAEQARTLLQVPRLHYSQRQTRSSATSDSIGLWVAPPGSCGAQCCSPSTARGPLGTCGFSRQGPAHSHCACPRMGQDRDRFMASFL